jgi:hypothetical protein
MIHIMALCAIIDDAERTLAKMRAVMGSGANEVTGACDAA